MAAEGDSGELLTRVAGLQQEMRVKKTFPAACTALAEICEREQAQEPAVAEALGAAGKACFAVLQARFSNPKFWQAGLELFLALEFHVPSATEALRWREAAMEEVDEDARERAKQQAQQRRYQEDRKHNQGRFNDANTPVSMAELLAASGAVLVDAGEDRRPAMSRNARDELRLVTVMEEETCVICQEDLPLGSKAKSMPCGHKFHDDCLLEWVKKSNSCPTCRFDELPSEKVHFDKEQRRIEKECPSHTKMYS